MAELLDDVGWNHEPDGVFSLGLLNRDPERCRRRSRQRS